MIHAIASLLLKYKIFLLTALKPLGVWGVGVIALVDSSSLPVPMDIVIAGYVWTDQRHAYAYAALGALGSCLGGLVPFLLGRAGGELFLLERLNRRRFEQLRDRFERQQFLAMLIPSMLPPPTPWKAFVFGAGVFEMRILNFLAAVFLGRLIHYALLAWLTIRYGPEMIVVLNRFAHQHLGGLFIGLSVLFGMLVVHYVRKNSARRKAEPTDPAETL